MKPYSEQLHFAALQKGSRIPVDILESATGEKHGTDRYNVQCMIIARQIEDHFADQGYTVTVRHIKGDIEVLTDEQAVKYNKKSFEKGLRKSHRSRRRLAGVVESNLSEYGKRHLERNLLMQGHVLTAAMSAKRDCMKTTPTVRNTPKIG